MLVDHFGFFFAEDDIWWGAFGRMAAPPFFFLMGYANTLRVPLRWIGLGVPLTLLDSWNNGWQWVAVNILLSFFAIRLVRPLIRPALERSGRIAFALAAAALTASQPVAGTLVDYGAGGWWWALVGMYQRLVNDAAAGAPNPSIAPGKGARLAAIRDVAVVAAASVYIWQEQQAYEFPDAPFWAVVVGVVLLQCGLRLVPARTEPIPATKARGRPCAVPWRLHARNLCAPAREL